jgi:regulator of sigma E protease
VGIFTALLILSFLIFFHELGHFTAARFFGVKVEVFSIGFGKRVLTKKWGDTEWSLSLIPLGGYVRMKGQDDSNPNLVNHDKDSYTSKRPWQKIIILLAGPFANFLLAFMLYFAIANIGVPKLLATIGDVNQTGAAYQAGIRAGDKITHINGHPIHYWEELSRNVQKSDQAIALTLVRENTAMDVSVVPKTQEVLNIYQEKEERKMLGIMADINSSVTVPYAPSEALSYAYTQTYRASMLIIKGLQKLISGMVPMEQLGGVVSIVDVTAKASAVGLSALLFFTALISVNLGVLNLLPIPALDGGHIMFNLYEMITRRKPSEEIMFKLTLAGWAILASLMLLGLYNDINRQLG